MKKEWQIKVLLRDLSEQEASEILDVLSDALLDKYPEMPAYLLMSVLKEDED